MSFQLRAPHCPVIVIGTHRDQVTKQIATESEDRVKDKYKDSRVYPSIAEVLSISSVLKGKMFHNSPIENLRGIIYQVATRLVPLDGVRCKTKY